MNYTLFAPEQLSGAITLPASKGISNPSFLYPDVCPEAISAENLSDCDDTRVMQQAFAHDDSTIDIHGAGTAMRFLTAYYAQKEGCRRTITGSARMQQRPIRILVDALRSLGADIRYTDHEGFPPLDICGRALTGGELLLPGDVSSQYISALLLIAPAMRDGLTLTLTGELVSMPYIEMTLAMMEYFGIEARRIGHTIEVPAGAYRPAPFRVEPDWSAASYWYEMAALAPSASIHLPGLSPHSLQGDARIEHLFAPLGVSTHPSADGTELRKSDSHIDTYTQDLSEQPDLAQTLVVACCLLGVPFHFTGLQTLRIKETDRIAALCNELNKLGYKLISSDSSLSWEGETVEPEAHPVINTYDDHRMAMAFAPAAFRFPGITIANPEVVDKSYPRYWEHLRQVGFTLDTPQKGDSTL